MKFTTTVGALALTVSADAHYVFPSLIVSGAITTAWNYVRQYPTYYTNNPVTTVSTDDIRCNVGGDSSFAPATMAVAAGSTIGMTSSPNIYHNGVGLAYMAKVPAGKTAATWDGSGAVWFKVHEIPPVLSPGKITFPTDSKYSENYLSLLSLPSSPKSQDPTLTRSFIDAANISFTIPKATPSGEYLVRVEHIALHVAQSVGGAQFYLSCGQINITGGGSGTPGPLVAFPGAYSATDPGILIDIYYPIVSINVSNKE